MRCNTAVALREESNPDLQNKQVEAEEQSSGRSGQILGWKHKHPQFKTNRWRLRTPLWYWLIPAALVYPLVARKQWWLKFA